MKRLDDVAGKSKAGLACRIGSLLKSNQMPQNEKEYLQKILETPVSDPQRIPSTAIAAALQQEGYQIGMTSVLKHRRKECRCYGPNPKYNEE